MKHKTSSAMATIFTVNAFRPTATASGYVPLATQAVSEAAAYVIDLGTVNGPPICSFPTSGTWSLLPRIVFYCSLVFALLARTHAWLIGGALGAALGFSALATLQVIGQIWTQRAMAELDLIPITGILAASCIMAVPLMNWSSTIRRLGLQSYEEQKMLENNKKKDYGPTRIVLVFWSLIVAIGFIAVFFGLQSYFGDADWIKIGIPLTNVTNPNGVSCVPQNGILNTTIGQLDGWSTFWMTGEFLDGNNCNDPCGEAVGIDTLFRSVDELFVFRISSIDRWYEAGQHLSHKDLQHLKLVYLYFRFMLFFLPFILIQGTMQVLIFWRTSPQRARWRIYAILSGGSPERPENIPERKTARAHFAWTMALLFYIFALLVLIGAPIAFFVTVLATEFTVHFIRQGETNVHVDQWGVFAVTGFVIIAAIICRLDPGRRIIWQETKYAAKLQRKENQIAYEKKMLQRVPSPDEPRITKGQSKNLWEQWKNMFVHIFAACHHAPHDLKNSAVYYAKDLFKMLAYEWFMFVQFCKHPQVKPQRRERAGKRWTVEHPESLHEADRKVQEERTLRVRENYKKAKEELKELQARNGKTSARSGRGDEESILGEKQQVVVTAQSISPPINASTGSGSSPSVHDHVAELPPQSGAAQSRNQALRNPARRPLPGSKQTTW